MNNLNDIKSQLIQNFLLISENVYISGVVSPVADSNLTAISLTQVSTENSQNITSLNTRSPITPHVERIPGTSTSTDQNAQQITSSGSLNNNNADNNNINISHNNNINNNNNNKYSNHNYTGSFPDQSSLIVLQPTATGYSSMLPSFSHYGTGKFLFFSMVMDKHILNTFAISYAQGSRNILYTI